MDLTLLSSVFDKSPVGLLLYCPDSLIYINNFAVHRLGTENPLTDHHMCSLLRMEEKRSFSDTIMIGDYYYRENLSFAFIENKKISVILLEDITAEVAAQDEADEFRSYFDALLDIGILAIDKEETITYINRTSCDKHGANPSDLIGKKFSYFSPEVTNSAILQTLHTRKPVENRQMKHSIPNVPRELSSAFPVYRNGQFQGAVSVLLFSRQINNLLNATSSLQIEYQSHMREKNTSSDTLYSFDDILGNDRELQKVKKIAMKICNVPSPVLIYGETGTGKELFAQSIHSTSGNRAKPFIGINCAAIPETLLESTLFGTEKGAFTGATNSPGLIEQAKDGTLFLDEINSMPVELQVKLLRVIQERSYRRVGGIQARKLNCRILSACNQPPKDCISIGSLRDDLYYRLAAVQLNIPPLRERGDDILLLAESAIQRYSEIYGLHPVLSSEAKVAFLNYNWPGNVRELNHIIESILILLEDTDEITFNDLPDTLKMCASPHYASVELPFTQEADQIYTVQEKKESKPLKDSLSNYERDKILHALEANNYNISKTARELGYSRSNLQYRIKKLNIEIKRKNS